MKLDKYFRSLESGQQELFARSVGTTTGYLKAHVFAPISRRKIPRREMLDKIWLESGGNVSRSDALNYFYPDPRVQS